MAKCSFQNKMSKLLIDLEALSAQLSQCLDALESVPRMKEIQDDDKPQTAIDLAYALGILLHIKCKVEGQDKELIKPELDRIKQYTRRLKIKTEKEGIEASKRMITHHLK